MPFDLQRYTQQLQQLVAEPSVSCAVPSWDMSNQRVIELLANWLDDYGFNTEIMPVQGHAGKYNLLATLGSGDGGLVFAGHSDTVPYDEDRWQSNPFQLSERDGRLYGLGATDMKGFFPAVLEAVRQIDSSKLQQPIMVLATADEESSMSGARQLAASGGLKARYAVVGEPTSLQPIHMHKGIMMESIRVVGAAGHSSNPALGNNALEAMHEVMTELMAYRGELQERYRNPGFAVEIPTLNLGCIHGGDGANRICGECELHFDLRSTPGMHNDELRQQISQRLTPLAERRKLDIVFSTLFEGVDPFYQSADAELIKTCESLTGQSPASVGFATEAPFYRKMGMQTVVMGPGSIDQAHQSNEFIALEQIEPAVNSFKGLIETLCMADIPSDKRPNHE
ncbi:acetylornithine deacetylase [Gilvimarinus agarilyticus]|uniref:acetylornithine deacetylase n=1 Tax=unclassified Gilvimarinus TaxID=2642066 RepID=UPI001C082560|nr:MULTISPECIES: acetylornithine deacetylase [unclassified Gilvimarinus]MBU2886598.1 acetylornithine deacetylase [Gilvimarinus agarilyticus]MDO6571266.1 acetylornithine deacetylase [Gilvimarinus sp. 2_MG-2023]MDO6746359.1 acetylornithine deacetylase [Gilvimarinus sp. 1_MG-2023]